MKRNNLISNVTYKYVILLLIFLLILIFSFNTTACEPRERVIKIGNQTVLSGDYKFYGEDQLVSTKLAASEISPVKIGGFEYRIDVITKDDEGNVEKAFLVSQEMTEEGVVGVIGSSFNGTTEVSIPVYMEYNIPIITSSAQGTELSKIGDNFFRLIINNRQKVENIANFIKNEINPRRLILIDNREEYSVSLVDFISEMLVDMEVNIINRYSVKVPSEDIDVLAENLVIDEPDVIFFCGQYDGLAYFITKVRESGLASRFITEERGMDDRINLLADEKYLEGLIAIVPEPPSLAKYSEDPRVIDFWRKYSDFVNEVKNVDIDQPGPYAPYSYDALYVLVDAMKRANSILPDDYIEELRSTSYDGVIGHIEFDSNGDRVNPLSTVFIIKEGSWVRY